MGGLRYWKDGRDVYDVILGLFDYPDTTAHPSFTVALQSNFEDGGGDSALFRFVGPDGVISVSWTELTLSRVGIVPSSAEAVLKGYNSVATFSKAQQEAFAAQYLKENPPRPTPEPKPDQRFVVPSGYDERLDHFAAFFNSVRTKAPVYEDAVFGLRAAGPALLANTSYREGRTIGWDPEKLIVLD